MTGQNLYNGPGGSSKGCILSVKLRLPTTQDRRCINSVEVPDGENAEPDHGINSSLTEAKTQIILVFADAIIAL